MLTSTPPAETPPPAPTPARLWHGSLGTALAGNARVSVALAAILALAAGLRFWGLEQSGYGNQYYAAAVASMSQSGHNFFYAAFDPGGFVSVDKPPLGLWVQVWSVQVFGFSGWSLLLPQALAGLLAVLALFWLVRRGFGPGAGLLAALLLALTPINVAADRNNTMDAQLVLTSLLAAGAALAAVERGRLRWLLAAALWLGVGFNIKMLQAVLIAPAVFGLYLLAAPLGWVKKLAHLALAGALFAALSLAWPLAVDLTPAEQRPYVGSSQNNTVMELIIGHNGAARLGPLAGWLGLSTGRGPNAGAPAQPPGQFQPGQPPLGRPPQGQPGQLPPGQLPPGQTGQLPPTGGRVGGDETGAAGPLRLFNAQLAGQASWFLPLALVSLLVLSAAAGRSWNPRQINLWFWGLWLIPQVVFFSYAGLFHRYYLEMMSPAIAALAGAGGVAALEQLTSGRRWPLALAGLGTAAGELIILTQTDTARWSVWLMPAVAGAALLGLLGLLVSDGRWRRGAAGLGLAGLLIAPGAYALTPVLSGGDLALPYAGPELLTRAAAPRRGGQTPAANALTQYLLSRRSGERYLAATQNANTAAPLILATGEPVMALGGFSGGDPILTATELEGRVAAGEVRFFLLPAAGRAPGVGNGPAPGPSAAGQWAASRCRLVPEREWQAPGQPTAAGPGGAQQLYDCALAP